MIERIVWAGNMFSANAGDGGSQGSWPQLRTCSRSFILDFADFSSVTLDILSMKNFWQVSMLKPLTTSLIGCFYELEMDESMRKARNVMEQLCIVHYFWIALYMGFSTRWIGVFPSGVPGIVFVRPYKEKEIRRRARNDAVHHREERIAEVKRYVPVFRTCTCSMFAQASDTNNIP